jgi:hypothetical protein
LRLLCIKRQKRETYIVTFKPKTQSIHHTYQHPKVKRKKNKWKNNCSKKPGLAKSRITPSVTSCGRLLHTDERLNLELQALTPLPLHKYTTPNNLHNAYQAHHWCTSNPGPCQSSPPPAIYTAARIANTKTSGY